MTEQVPSGLPEDDVSDQQREPESSTGVPAVDQVLSDIDQVDGLPLDQHQEAFERAHASLRSALDAGSDDPA